MSNATARRSEVPFGHHDHFFIGGSWVKPSTDARLDVITPATEELYVSVGSVAQTVTRGARELPAGNLEEGSRTSRGCGANLAQ
jgi:hypothetical protein